MTEATEIHRDANGAIDVAYYVVRGRRLHGQAVRRMTAKAVVDMVKLLGRLIDRAPRGAETAG